MRRKFNRRQILKGLGIGGLIFPPLDAFAVEPYWLKHKELKLGDDGFSIDHFTDVHFKGDPAMFEKVVGIINDSPAEVAAFTGDLVDSKDGAHLGEALKWIEKIEKPVFGVIGNHDPVDSASLKMFKESFESTGGGFLNNEAMDYKGWTFLGLRSMSLPIPLHSKSGKKSICLCHYPYVAHKAQGWHFRLTLAGHSHGGQVRLPLIGPVVVPRGVGKYDRGLYQTSLGPLHVSVGVGTFFIPVRFLCRPEVVTIHL